MLSTKSRKKGQFVLTSNLAALLKERGKTQEDLAVKTGLRPERISRLARQPIVRRIFAETSTAICLAVSVWPRLKDRKKVPIRLDALFPLRQVNRKKG
jgi:transcriptional regulator with XRE-family HTH domain